MKNIISFVAILIPVSLLAQNENKKDTAKSDRMIVRNGAVVTFAQMDQRKIYHWANGQRATPTGREAGEHVSGYVKLIGDDSAVVVKDPFDKR